MALLKLYSLTNTNNLKVNERIITPHSIPIFVLPPTLESCRNSKYLSHSTRKLH